MKKYNILFITHYSELYGANRSLLEVIKGLRDHCNKIVVVVPSDGDIIKELKGIGVEYRIIQFHPLAEYRWRSRNALYRFYWDIIWLYRGVRALYHNFFLNKELSELAHEAKTDLVCFNSTLAVTGFRVKAKGKKKIPHVIYLRELLSDHFSIVPYFGFDSYYRTLDRCDVAISISQFVSKSFEYKLNIPVRIIWNPFSTVSGPTELQERNKSIFRFGIVGIVGGKKNQTEAIKALGILKDKGYHDLRLLVVGSGEKDSLREEAQKLVIADYVTFTGFISDMSSVYKEIDVCLICSDHEAFGRVTVEAMLYGKPVIGKKSGATPELLQEGRYGLLYSNGPVELAEKMENLYLDEGLRESLALRGRLYAEETFATGQSITALLSLFNELVNCP